MRAVKIIEDNQYFLSNISQGSINTHSITIPAGTQQLKLMVYWHDKEGSANASPALVNDLDIELFDNVGNSVELPWVLDPTPTSASLNANAIKAINIFFIYNFPLLIIFKLTLKKISIGTLLEKT